MAKSDWMSGFAKRNWAKLTLLVFLALFAAAELPSFNQFHVNRDEPLYSWQSLAIYHNPEMIFSEEVNKPYPALIPLLSSPLNAFFEPPLPVRIVVFLFSLVALAFTYLVGKKLFSEKAGLAAMLFLMLSPTFFFFSSKAMPDVPVVSLATIVIYLLLTLDKKRVVLLPLLVLAMYVIKPSSLVVLPPIVLFLLLRYRSKLSLKHVAIAIIGSALLIAAGFLLSPYASWSSLYTNWLSLDFGPGYPEFVLTKAVSIFREVAGIPLSFFALLALARLKKKISAGVQLLLLWFFLTILPFIAASCPPNRYYLLAIPALAVIAGSYPAKLVEERRHFMLAASLAVAAGLVVTSTFYSASLQPVGLQAVHTNADQNNLESWLRVTLTKEDRLVILSEEYIMREIRLAAEKQLPNPEQQMAVNPSKQEFEEIVANTGTRFYLVIDDMSPSKGFWLYSQDQDWQAYLEELGFEKEAEFLREGFGLLEAYSIYKKP